MMTLAAAEALIAVERARALSAREEGNEGKVRVCARRAAGIAVAHWHERHGRDHRGRDALSLLKGLREDPAAPPEVREAAGRLTARVTPEFTSPHGEDPLDDADIVIRRLLEGAV
jgi:hypothetical protein